MKRKPSIYYTPKTDTSSRYIILLLATMCTGIAVCGLLMDNAGIL